MLLIIIKPLTQPLCIKTQNKWLAIRSGKQGGKKGGKKDGKKDGKKGGEKGGKKGAKKRKTVANSA